MNSGSKNYYTSPTGDLRACGPDAPDVCMWRGVWKGSSAESLMHPLNRRSGGRALSLGLVEFSAGQDGGPRTRGIQAEGPA